MLAGLAMSGPTLLAPLFRAACAVCGLVPGPLCSECEADFFPGERARCVRCAIALHGAGAICGQCLAAPPHFHRATALADYASPVDGMVMALKFRAHLELASIFGELLARRVTPSRDAIVVPIPLAHERLSDRGFNQSLQVARAFCRRSGARLAPDLVRRIRHTPPQQNLSLDARRSNIRGAFVVCGNVRDAEVLVIDDVMTSGSTMDEIARVLVAAGAQTVHAVVVARTP